MDLSVKSQENISVMLDAIVKKLQLVNTSVMKAEHFDVDHYDELYDLYKMVTKQDQFSVNEIEAIVAELGALRSK